MRAATRKTKQLTNFSDLGLAAPILKALQGEGYDDAHRHPGPGHPDRARGPRPARHRPDRHRQDRGIRPADPASPGRRPPPAQRKGCRVLVLSPTRELATPDRRKLPHLRPPSRPHRRPSCSAASGHRPQIQALARGVDVLVATPGRLLDHIAERNVSLAGTEILVLDEADQMLDLGFLPPIRRIVSQLAAEAPEPVLLGHHAARDRQAGRRAAARSGAGSRSRPSATTVDSVTQRVIHVESRKKRSLLVELFADPQMSRTLVFTRTKRGADRVARHLEDGGHSRRRHPRQQEPVAARAGARGLSRVRRSASWSRPTSPRAASTSIR